jgi:hypothetical protein
MTRSSAVDDASIQVQVTSDSAAEVRCDEPSLPLRDFSFSSFFDVGGIGDQEMGPLSTNYPIKYDSITLMTRKGRTWFILVQILRPHIPVATVPYP